MRRYPDEPRWVLLWLLYVVCVGVFCGALYLFGSLFWPTAPTGATLGLSLAAIVAGGIVYLLIVWRAASTLRRT